MRSRITRVGLALTICVLGAGTPGERVAAAPATPPHIAAKPNNLMVNTRSTLTGSGFPARTKLTIKECPATGWIVPQHPCVTNNTISVVTDAHGRFTHKFRVELCGGKRGAFPTSQICYIGDPHPEGIDTIRLLGAAAVTVTYP